ncbi:tyrosine-protein phosphatase [Christensenellaceae bacterium OttesenSCG-928-K19]|nr:tyrosine-protein phosphatase [Christensenellaceae bacterium OttesenSCG-928-K19]
MKESLFNKPENFRDLGGIKTTDGRQVKPGRLLRSGQLIGLDKQEKALLLGECGLKTVVDFRSAQETGRHPDDDLPGVRVVNFDLMEEMAEYTPGTDTMQKITNVEGVHQFMMTVYGLTMQNGGSQKKLAEFIKLVRGQQQGAVLFHCFAGKDRTGMAAAIILTLLGVDRQEIMKDYLKTNEMRAEANGKMVEAARAKGIPEEELATMNEFMVVRQQYMEHVYEMAEKDSGSLLEFIKKHLKVSDADMESLRENYLM